MVGLPLAVLVGLKDPQSDAEQVTLHLTPASLGSLLTMAATLAVVPMLIDEGGAVLKVTEIGNTSLPSPPPQALKPSRTSAIDS